MKPGIAQQQDDQEPDEQDLAEPSEAEQANPEGMDDPVAAAAPAEDAATAPEPADSSGVTSEAKASPEEEDAMKRGLDLGSQLLYSNDQVNAAIVKMLKTQPLALAVSEATSQIVHQVDKKLNLPETVIAQFGMTIAALILDLAQQLGVLKQTDPQTMKRIIVSVMQRLFQDYGVDPEQAKQLSAQVDPAQLKQQMQQVGSMYGK